MRARPTRDTATAVRCSSRLEDDVNETEGMRIGEVARRAGVKPSLIRYYEDLGLLPEPARISGQRRYGPAVLRRLAVIDVAQRAGMRLHEIKLLVDHGNEPMSRQLRELAERKLPEIDALMERAQRVRDWLDAASACQCQRIDDCALFDDAPAAPRQPPFGLPVRPGGARA
jgi:MerR family redox-sensitive transcriptional activator SoxR